MPDPGPESPESYPIFHQPWWLDAVAPGAWDEVAVRRDGVVAGRLPFVVRRRAGLTSLVQPPLTQALGPWIAEAATVNGRANDFEKRILDELLDALPPFDVFDQNLTTALGTWLPFYWRGFDVRPRVTYRLEGLRDPDAIWGAFDPDVRSQVRSAEARLVVRDDGPLDALLELNRETLERKTVTGGYTAADVRRIDDACAARGARLLLLAEDPEGRPHAGIYVVRDELRAYYLMGGRAARHERGATSLLLWHAIRRMAAETDCFDFEGSMVESLERYFRAFGARQVTYLHVRKESGRAMLARRLLRRG